MPRPQLAGCLESIQGLHFQVHGHQIGLEAVAPFFTAAPCHIVENRYSLARLARMSHTSYATAMDSVHDENDTTCKPNDW